ncbi:MAG TPA: radical SAM protein [Verrucomicrobiae bacterium]|nr:radical SAM protein [Verrucomicrobiae bacterium]
MPNRWQNMQWLNGEDGAQHSLREQARETRDAKFGRRVFVRGVVEVSNHCRQNCHYCAMRRQNRELPRYRLDVEELAELIIHHHPRSITDIDIQAGEDPAAVREVALPLLRLLRRHTNLGLMLCLGTLTPREYDELREAGGEFYVLKIETGDAARYEAIEAPGTLARRLEVVRYLASTGWRVSSGLIVGLPKQTNEHLIHSLELLTQLPLAGCSVSPFVAGGHTPFAGEPNGSIDLTLNCLAWMRLAVPHWIIPAVSAMKLVSTDGYVRALNAGANLATVNLTPPAVRTDYPIYKQDRIFMDEERVLSAIRMAGCEPSRIGVTEHLRNGVVAGALH